MKNLLLLLFTALPFCIVAQTVTVKITLNAIEGGTHNFINVTLIDIASNAKFSGKTDATGKVSIAVPPNASYDVKIPNYTSKKIINVPNAPGATMSSTLTYSRNMVAQDAAFVMDASEKAGVDAFANSLPDTTWFRGSDPFKSYDMSYYSNVELSLRDLKQGPLSGETVTLTGRKRKKSFKGTTGANGKIVLYLPKGDDYDLSFYYHKNYEMTECKYSKGSSEITWEFEYMGTKEFARRKKEEEDRQKAEIAAQLKAQADAKESQKQARAANASLPYSENRIAGVMDRNNFTNPLVICDGSSNMAYIMDELTAWFGKNEKKNPTSQFVFFNDGDMKSEKEKKIGGTGGLYYTPALPLDKLTVFMNAVLDKSMDQDGPDNCVEALIEGVKMAKKPFGDIILVVDNHSSARDIELLPQFTGHPVHVVVFCSIRGGCDHGSCKPDYLKIAWKTKGTLHIDGMDYNNIGSMKNGDIIEVTGAKTKYKLVNGEFFNM
jgi:hypothetical protein